eukprot:3885808-Pyramimonas_sp.AAC.1
MQILLLLLLLLVLVVPTPRRTCGTFRPRRGGEGAHVQHSARSSGTRGSRAVDDDGSPVWVLGLLP